MKSNTLPIKASQIQLQFISSPTAMQASLQQPQLGTVCNAVVPCAPATTSCQPVPGCSTSGFARPLMSSGSPPVCRGVQMFQSKSAALPAASVSPAVCLAALRSQMSTLLSTTSAPSSSTSVVSSSSIHHAKSVPVPMSDTPPSTCIRPKVLTPNPQTPVSTTRCPGSATGVRPVRPIQPLPPVRTSSCPTKVIPGSQQPAGEGYEEVPMHEPDLSRKPSRSALKSSKSTGAQSFQQQLEKALRSSQKHAGCYPFPPSSASDAVTSTGLCRSKSGDCGKSAAKSLPAVPPKPRVM